MPLTYGSYLKIDELLALLAAGDAFSSLATFKRVLTVFKTLVAQIDVKSTLFQPLFPDLWAIRPML